LYDTDIVVSVEQKHILPIGMAADGFFISGDNGKQTEGFRKGFYYY